MRTFVDSGLYVCHRRRKAFPNIRLETCLYGRFFGDETRMLYWPATTFCYR